MDLRVSTAAAVETTAADDFVTNSLRTELLEATPTSRKEALCWVYDDMSARAENQDVRSRFTRHLLKELVPIDEGFSKALLLYFCECGSVKFVVDLISPSEWRKFFVSEDEASPSLGILKSFFGNFRYDGEHLKGAKALQQYALRKRENVWHHLRWRGKNSQSPVVCATKPGTFCELDVEKTLRGEFGDERNGFWSSEDFIKCLRESGKDTIMINCSYFVDLLFARLRFKDSTDVLKLKGDMYSFLMQQQHAYNCQRLLPVVQRENDLLKLANVLFQSNYKDLDELCLVTALTFRARLFANALNEDTVQKLLSHDVKEINAPTKLARLCQYFVVRMKLMRGVLDVEEVMKRSCIKFELTREDEYIKEKKKKKKRKKREEDARDDESQDQRWRIDDDPIAICAKSDLVDRILERFL